MKHHITQPTDIHVPLRWQTRGMWLLLLLPLLLVATSVSLRLHATAYDIPMTNSLDTLLLREIHHVEEDTEHHAYRWTTAASQLVCESFVVVSPAFLQIKSGGLAPSMSTPRQLVTHIDSRILPAVPIAAYPRRYTMLLPPDMLRDGSFIATFHTDVSRIPPDKRLLGIRLDGISVGWFVGAWARVPLRVLLVQWGILAIILTITWYFTPSVRITALVALLSSGWLAWTTSDALLIAAQWHYRLCATGLAFLLVYVATTPLIARFFAWDDDVPPHNERRLLWAVVLLGASIRMAFILYPLFTSHDWYIHLRRINNFLNGGFIIYDHPAEFNKKMTIVPPAPYLLYAPFTLFTSYTVVAMQWVYALCDSITVLLVGLLVRAVGGRWRVAIMTALLVALFPLTFTTLYWGFGPQAIGQTVTVLFVLLMAQRQAVVTMPHRAVPPVSWVVGGGVFVIILFSHVGSGMLGGFLLAWYCGFMLLVYYQHTSRWRPWLLLMLASGGVVFVLLYSLVFGLQVHGLATNDRLMWDADDIFRMQWTLQSLYATFNPLGVAIPFISIGYAIYRIALPYRWLFVAWLVSAGGFFVIDVATGLQVRYGYFIVPLMSIGLAWLLNDTIRRAQRIGWVVTVCIIVLVGYVGIELWWLGVFAGMKPSLRGLTH